MSSPFQKQFSSKSPLHGAYSSGADAMVTVSDAGHFAKLQSDIKGATLAAMEPKVSKCDSIKNNWHAGKMTDKAYADASKDCGETKDESSIMELIGILLSPNPTLTNTNWMEYKIETTLIDYCNKTV